MDAAELDTHVSIPRRRILKSVTLQQRILCPIALSTEEALIGGTPSMCKDLCYKGKSCRLQGLPSGRRLGIEVLSLTHGACVSQIFDQLGVSVWS